MFREQTLAEFLDGLASKAATPGGGAAAALAGAMGAALVSMVCNLTIGKKRYADVEDEMKAVLERSEALRAKLLDLVEEDVTAFDEVSAAYRMPKGTDEEKAARSAAIQEALKIAESTPMKTAETCADVLELTVIVAEKGNKNVVSDAGTAAMMAIGGLSSAGFNVKINLGGIKDAAFVERESKRLELCLDRGVKAKEKALSFVDARL